MDRQKPATNARGHLLREAPPLRRRPTAPREEAEEAQTERSLNREHLDGGARRAEADGRLGGGRVQVAVTAVATVSSAEAGAIQVPLGISRVYILYALAKQAAIMHA